MCVLEILSAVRSRINILNACMYVYGYIDRVGSGGWVSDGVSTVGNDTDESTTTVQCSSTHLTSFAVLVDIGDGLKVCLFFLHSR